MRDLDYVDQLDLSGLTFSDWLDVLAETENDDVLVDFLGTNHAAVLNDAGSTLLVTFEQFSKLDQTTGHPRSWDIAHQFGWSTLTLLCDRFEWFRAPHVYAYFDRLVDEGTLDHYKRVIFLGIDETSHAAAVFSVIAPLCDVILFGPVATKSTHLASWDLRAPDARRLDFTTRFSFGPTLTDTANRVILIYDKSNPNEAMHAALFNGPNATHISLPLYQHAWDAVLNFDLMSESLRALDGASPNQALFSMLRQRRNNPDYLRALLNRSVTRRQPLLTQKLCEYTLSKFKDAPRFLSALKQLDTVK